MKKAICIAATVMTIFMAGCSKPASVKEVITERIQYDVGIRNTDPEQDWWVQNLEGPSREKFVNTVLDAVWAGKVKAYDFFSNRELTASEVKELFGHTDTISVERAEPPHEIYDTVITTGLNRKEINRIRFLEEWKMDSRTLQFDKKVVGICPLEARYEETGELRGYAPLFWVFLSADYPGKLTGR
jgi:hypothetical protein